MDVGKIKTQTFRLWPIYFNPSRGQSAVFFSSFGATPPNDIAKMAVWEAPGRLPSQRWTVPEQTQLWEGSGVRLPDFSTAAEQKAWEWPHRRGGRRASLFPPRLTPSLALAHASGELPGWTDFPSLRTDGQAADQRPHRKPSGFTKRRGWRSWDWGGREAGTGSWYSRTVGATGLPRNRLALWRTPTAFPTQQASSQLRHLGGPRAHLTVRHPTGVHVPRCQPPEPLSPPYTSFQPAPRLYPQLAPASTAACVRKCSLERRPAPRCS